jgi:hypothetical protein
VGSAHAGGTENLAPHARPTAVQEGDLVKSPGDARFLTALVGKQVLKVTTDTTNITNGFLRLETDGGLTLYVRWDHGDVSVAFVEKS